MAGEPLANDDDETLICLFDDFYNRFYRYLLIYRFVVFKIEDFLDRGINSKCKK